MAGTAARVEGAHVDGALAVALVAAGASLVGAVLTYRASKQATKVSAASAARSADINEQAAQLQWVKELRAEAADAKNEVKEMRAEVTDLRRQLAITTRETEHLIAELQLFRRTAWREGMSIERLRDFIGPPPSSANGWPS